MIICSCNVISDKEVRDLVKPCGRAASCARDVFRGLGCAPKCGRCVRQIQALFDAESGVISQNASVDRRESILADAYNN